MIKSAATWHKAELHISDIDMLPTKTLCHVFKHTHYLVMQLEASVITCQENSTLSFADDTFLLVRVNSLLVHYCGNKIMNKNGTNLTRNLQHHCHYLRVAIFPEANSLNDQLQCDLKGQIFNRRFNWQVIRIVVRPYIGKLLLILIPSSPISFLILSQLTWFFWLVRQNM